MKKLKKASLLAAVLLAASLFSGCGEETTEIMGFKEISADGHAYDLFVPDEWVLNTSTGVTSAYDANDRSNVSVTVCEVKSDITTIDALWAANEPTLKAAFTDFEYICNGVETKLDGVIAKEYIYTGTMADETYTQRQIIALHEGYFYTFTYTAFSEKYEEHTEDIQAILGYFTFN
ncbi:MAG: hypothetical protein IJY93_06780 [Clostridia bacterium]|nr:hypothetical protein [Clostridia bacterium]